MGMIGEKGSDVKVKSFSWDMGLGDRDGNIESRKKDGGEDNGVYILFHYWYYGQN